MPAPIRTETMTFGDFDPVYVATCRFCEGQIVAVQYSTAEAADKGRLHLQNSHSSVRWSLLPGGDGFNDQIGELPGSSYRTKIGPARGKDGWSWAVLEGSKEVAGGYTMGELSARHTAESWLLNDPR